MEQQKQNLLKILLIINLVVSTCTAIGVGYLAYKQGQSPDFSEMGSRGDRQGFPGNEQQLPPGQDQSVQE